MFLRFFFLRDKDGSETGSKIGMTVNVSACSGTPVGVRSDRKAYFTVSATFFFAGLLDRLDDACTSSEQTSRERAESAKFYLSQVPCSTGISKNAVLV